MFLGAAVHQYGFRFGRAFDKVSSSAFIVTKNAGIRIDVFSRFNGFLFLTTDNAPGFSSMEADADITFPHVLIAVCSASEQFESHGLSNVLIFRHGDSGML
jgi:hypothetical protein